MGSGSGSGWAWGHPGGARVGRRTVLRAGAAGILGLADAHLGALRAVAGVAGGGGAGGAGFGGARSAVFVFLSGGLGQLDSFDMKPEAPEDIRGEFRPIATETPGLEICECLPRLAKCSRLWSLVRSLTHPWNEHSQGHQAMLSGRSALPAGFDPTKPRAEDWPSIASVAGDRRAGRNNLPPAVALPERLVHNTGRVLPGQFGGQMGSRRDPWFLELSRFEPRAYGAFPAYEFDHQDRPRAEGARGRERFEAPSLTLPEGFGTDRLRSRVELLRHVDAQRAAWEGSAEREAGGASGLDGYRAAAVALLTDPAARRAFDLSDAEPGELERYGDHSFGWSLLIARRLVEAGVSMVQVNLGNNETWDTHGNAFPHLREKLYPPMDQAVSAFVEDLEARGLLETTLVAMAGEFGRTPRISLLPQHYKGPGRDHWGRAQTVWLAGGGVQGGRVTGATDRIGSAPTREPQTPENFAATIYHALGIPKTDAWRDELGRPHHIYHGDPFPGLF